MSQQDIQDIEEKNESENTAGQNEKDGNSSQDGSGDNQIRDMSAVSVRSGKSRIYCMSIIGEIEGHMALPPQSKTTKYEHVIPELCLLYTSPSPRD